MNPEQYTTPPQQYTPYVSNYTPPPSTRKWQVLGVAAILVVTAGLIGYFVFGIGAGHNLQEDEEHKYEATMVINQNGFQPATLTVRPDTRVYFESHDGEGHRIVANQAHSKDTTIFAASADQGSLADAGGYAYSFHHKGIYTFHDASNPTQNGEIIVE